MIHVLVLDDEPAVVGITVEILETLPVKPIPALTCAQADKVLADVRVPIGVIDVALTDGNGILWRRERYKKTGNLEYAVFVSGLFALDSFLLEEEAQSSKVRFLEKPFSVDLLRDIVNEFAKEASRG